MSLTGDYQREHEIAMAASELCNPDIDPQARFEISMMTILATGIVTSAVTCLILLVTWQFSLALLFAIWLWAAGLAAIFYFGRLPRLFGFGYVSGAFEYGRYRFFEGPLTRLTKTLRFHPRNGS